MAKQKINILSEIEQSKYFKRKPGSGGRRKGAGAKKKEKRYRFNSYISETQAKEWGEGETKEHIDKGVLRVKAMVQLELDKLKKP